MTGRIFRSVCFAAMAVFLACLALIVAILYRHSVQSHQERLRSQSALAAQGIGNEGLDYLEGLDPQGFRLTWIAPDGSILYDSERDPASMENHREREEVLQALEEGYGQSARYSLTLDEAQLYAARRLSDGSVLRLSASQSDALRQVLAILQPIFLVALLAVALSLLLAHRLSRRIVGPLNNLNLDEPLKNERYAELQPLLQRIDSQQCQLRAQAQELQQRRDEFEAITGSMSEGLVLLNNRGQILSINAAAARILRVQDDCRGQSFRLVHPSLELEALLLDARNGRRGSLTLPLAEGLYEFDASPVVSEGLVSGTALLLFDLSERAAAEEMRREFTANVSHELKTPLHTISGCAELLRGGLVKAGDERQFADQIYTEAQRMILLVEDILRLSRLDEGAPDMRPEALDLYALAEAALSELRPAAEAAGLPLTLEGARAPMEGIAPLLHGVIFNLCDNALKYNRPDGFVRVTVSPEDDGGALLCVADGGIGIPTEHQSRIFERFYRVDKSHSKTLGGTGLGLSIVKHAVALHQGRLELDSAPGRGTVVRVRFPGKEKA